MEENRTTKRGVDITRRNLGAILGGGALLATLPKVAATPKRSAAMPEKSATAPVLGKEPHSCKTPSQAVLTGTYAAAIQAYRSTASGAPAASDYRNLASSLRIFFDHLDELGVSEAIEARMKSRAPGSIDSKTIGKIRKRLASTGMPYVEELMKRLEDGRRSPHAAAIFSQNGARGVYDRMIQEVIDVGNKIDSTPGLYARKPGLAVRPVAWGCHLFDDLLEAVIEGIMGAPEAVAAFCSTGVGACVCAAVGVAVVASWFAQQSFC